MGLFRTSKRDKLVNDILNKRGESLSEEKKGADTKKWLTITSLIFVMTIIIALGTGFMMSPEGQRSIAEAYANFKDVTIDPVLDFYSGITSVGAGDYFDYSTNTSSKKMGIDLSDFRVVAGQNVPAGYATDFIYDIECINVPRDSTYDAEFYCSFNITQEGGHALEQPRTIYGNVIPDSLLTIRRDSQPVCRLSSEQTSELNGPYIVYGSFAFDFPKQEVSMPVYFISGELSDSLGDQDFFDEYSLDVSASDIRTTYNGEPLSIGIGVRGEGKEEQPVVVRSGDVISYNTLGITLRNEWNGDLMELYDFTLYLPEGIQLNDQLNDEPNPSCPFIYTGEESRYNTYKLDDSMVQLFDFYFASNEFFGKSDYRSFQCWLEIDPEILIGKPYVVKEYKADIEYRYKVDEKSESITIIGEEGDSQ